MDEVVRNLLDKWEALPELGCNHCGAVFKGSHECDYERLKEDNARLREALENTQEQLFSIRGMNKHHDNHITGLCIEIRQALSGDPDD